MTKGFKNKELMKSVFGGEDKANHVNMDMDFFAEIRKMESEEYFTSSSHKAILYSYVWVVSYLWKYAKYGKLKIAPQDIKQLLNLNVKDSRVDYLIKRNGLSDAMGYTRNTRNFPVDYGIVDGIFNIYCVNDLGQELKDELLKGYPNRSSYKKPLLLYERENKPGLLYSKEDVVSLSVREYLRCVYVAGAEGFYLYAYIKYRSKMLAGNYVNIRLAELSAFMGCERRKLQRILKALIDAKLIEATSEIKNINGKVTQENQYRAAPHPK